MIAECANQLFTLISAVPGLTTSTGMTVGGKSPDPGMTKIPLPAAWVLPVSGTSLDDMRNPLPPTIAMIEQEFAVMLHVPYTSQSDLIANQLPLLENVIKAVQGQEAPTGERWVAKGYKLVVVNPDRLVFHISFFLGSVFA
ncbi:MAG: hypothetical protein KGL39_11030 [Patescibacteria group bacterium]|nr:hypothetical protein [Patescibacteria group bacterium]